MYIDRYIPNHSNCLIFTKSVLVTTLKETSAINNQNARCIQNIFLERKQNVSYKTHPNHLQSISRKLLMTFLTNLTLLSYI